MVQVHVRVRLIEGRGLLETLKQRFERDFLPVIRQQEGFAACELLADRDHPGWAELRIAFADEGLRTRWVNSSAHQTAWPHLSALFGEARVHRYDVLSWVRGDNRMTQEEKT